MIENQLKIIDTIKLLIYKEIPELLTKVNIDDDNIFLDPIFYAYFNNKKDKKFPATLLEEIIQGYYIEQRNPIIEYSYNKNTIAYLPNLGYFKNGKKISNIFKLHDFELIKELHPLFEKYFVQFYRSEIVHQEPEYDSACESCHKDLDIAISLIKEHLPAFYCELTFANKKIYIHNNPKILNFTSIETLGMLYLYVLGSNNVIYFIEELIHQGSHNYFYHKLFDKDRFFKIDSLTLMSEISDNPYDYRNLYGAFHGLYTVTKRVECFDILLSKNVFFGYQKHELLGRFTDQFTRFRTGMKQVDHKKALTLEGVELYNELDRRCESILNKYKSLEDIFDLSHRDLDFRYDDFCLTNSYNDFLEKDKKGIYNFN